jgi:NADPH:quinone reductase-like Zn-dependent oxidoreductase
MRAVVYDRYGGPEVLQLRKVDLPALHDDQVLVRVHATSVNSWDWDLLTRKPRWTRAGSWSKPRYRILGADIAGRVEAVGKDVDDFQRGDEVFGDVSGHGWGGFAKYVCVSPAALALKPPALSFVEAAAVPQAGILALQGLQNQGQIAAEKRVLINGAGGGVGTFAVQIAESRGAEVTGVDGAAKLDQLQSLGAEHVIDYARDDYTRMGERYDLILDCVATRSVFGFRRCLSSGDSSPSGGGCECCCRWWHWGRCWGAPTTAGLGC